jgi:glycosyltransferase involved in cell wall biosynthesis
MLEYKLITFDVGPKREEFRQLIIDLRLQDKVFMLPFISRSQLLSVIAHADLVFGNYSDIDAHLNGSLSFALALGKPLITNKKYFTGSDTYNCIPLDDYCNETTPAKLVKLIDNEHELSLLGEQGADWYIRARKQFINYVVASFDEREIPK